MFKMIKCGVIGVGALAVLGALFFGTDLFSYAKSSKKMLQTSVKESIPVQFEIQRARDLLEELIPEMHANLRTVAQEEVEVASLEKEVHADREAITGERARIQKFRRDLDSIPTLASQTSAEREALEDLSQRFERFRTSEMLLLGKEKLLSNRKKSLQAAIQRLEKTRIARVELAAQIEALEGQFRLLQAQGTANDLRLDTTKLAQTQRLLGDVKKRLEIAQRVLDREARFSDPEPVKTVTVQGLVEEIDAFFEKSSPESAGTREVESSRPAETARY